MKLNPNLKIWMILLAFIITIILFVVITNPSVYGLEPLAGVKLYDDPNKDTLPYCKPGQYPQGNATEIIRSIMKDETGKIVGFNLTKPDICREKPLEFDGAAIILFSNK